jgi:hypothetical protein
LDLLRGQQEVKNSVDVVSNLTVLVVNQVDQNWNELRFVFLELFFAFTLQAQIHHQGCQVLN